MRLNQRHLGLDDGGDVSRHKATRPGTNDDQVAVKPGRSKVIPARIHLAAPEKLQNLADDQRQHAQQHKRANKRWRGDGLERINLGQLRAGIHINHGSGQHAQLADPGVCPGLDAAQAHQQVEHEKGHQRNQPQGKEVKSAFFFNALVDLVQPPPKARLNAVLQQIARHQHGQRRAQR